MELNGNDEPETSGQMVDTSGPASRRPMRKTTKKSQLQDDSIMSTNNSSIVSKRSVEAIYYPDEPAFFRYFVPKFKRRAPLINRGYYLRLKLIDVTLRDFLQESATPGSRKVIVNLGAGSDVIPWQCLHRYGDHCRGVTFVDIDFPDLIAKKRRIVLETPELLAPLTGVDTSLEQFVSDQYVQIGCDLRDLQRLREALTSLLAEPCQLLFVAEVSITYMETRACNDLIAWASTLGPAQFCLLEQLLPDGPDHPFATTMLRHFNKIGTPLRSIQQYPTLASQTARFSSRGWSQVKSISLLQAWGMSHYMTTAERCKLDEVEPFDEWEDFALFAAHYCIVLAGNNRDNASEYADSAAAHEDIPHENSKPPHLSIDLLHFEGDSAPERIARRFATPIPLRDSLGHCYWANFLGMGSKDRLRSYDIYRQSVQGPSTPGLLMPRDGPGVRMCHALVDIGDSGFLLAGGRLSPSSPRSDAWILLKGHYEWRETHQLPMPLFRHSMVRLGSTSLALLVGGKTGAGSVSDQFLIYHPGRGWISCCLIGPVQPMPTFGGLLTCGNTTSEGVGTFSGLFAGGMTAEGTVADQVLHWQLDISDIEGPTIAFSSLSVTSSGRPSSEARAKLVRFGATALTVGRDILVVGGVAGQDLLPRKHDMLICNVSGSTCEVAGYLVPQPGTPAIGPPLLVGASVAMNNDNMVVIMGGGATCFSMGTFWNKGFYSFALPGLSTSSNNHCLRWNFWRTLDVEETKPVPRPDRFDAGIESTGPSVTAIPRVHVESTKQFDRILKNGKPVIITGMDIGTCTSTWSTFHMAEKVGEDREVVVHESNTHAMDFVGKNFRYTKMRFGDFLHQVDAGQRLYLRALSATQPADQAADLEHDFPRLSDEFVLPPELSLVVDNQFSTVLRISGPVNMWLHYDVMANIYCQIAGSKRLLLFPPTDVSHLSFAAGASSSSIDVFASLDSASLSPTHPWEAILEPGEILFIPPLWPHTATPISKMSVAVNVFFREPGEKYAPGRDIYGNRDLAPYIKGRQDLARIVGGFDKMTESAREFYLTRLAQEMSEMSRA